MQQDITEKIVTYMTVMQQFEIHECKLLPFSYIKIE